MVRHTRKQKPKQWLCTIAVFHLYWTISDHILSLTVVFLLDYIRSYLESNSRLPIPHFDLSRCGIILYLLFVKSNIFRLKTLLKLSTVCTLQEKRRITIYLYTLLGCLSVCICIQLPSKLLNRSGLNFLGSCVTPGKVYEWKIF